MQLCEDSLKFNSLISCYFIGKEERAGGQRPSPPPSKGQRFLSPWRMDGRSGGGRRWVMEECGMPPPPLLIKGRSWGSFAPLDQFGHRGRRESGLARYPNQRWPGFPPPPPATCMRDTWRASNIKGMGEAAAPYPVILGRGRLEDHNPSPPK